ncbi:MAG: hypothetical protein HQL87_01810 [Magnetococcales bacterium]|nr:hypothetical protein [Magnetococcales bacterium]
MIAEQLKNKINYMVKTSKFYRNRFKKNKNSKNFCGKKTKIRPVLGRRRTASPDPSTFFFDHYQWGRRGIIPSGGVQGRRPRQRQRRFKTTRLPPIPVTLWQSMAQKHKNIENNAIMEYSTASNVLRWWKERAPALKATNSQTDQDASKASRKSQNFIKTPSHS